MSVLFREWKECHLLIIDCCKVTEKGEVLWNEAKIINFLEKLGYRTLWIGDEVKIVQIKENDIKKVSLAEIKEVILERLNRSEGQKIRMHLVRNNIFFSQELINKLKEAIPDEVYKDTVFFHFDNGKWTINHDEMYFTLGEWME